MGTAAKRIRENRTITVDFRDDATYLQLLGDGKAFVEFVCAFLLSLGFQLAHKATCRGGGCLTRHSHYISPIALYRLICAVGHQSLVPVLTRCGLPLPVYFLADDKHSRCLTAKVYLPTMICDRVLWHLGDTEAASTAAFTQSYRVRGILTDGCDSTTSSMRTLFPGARLGTCLRHAINKLPAKLVAIPSS